MTTQQKNWSAFSVALVASAMVLVLATCSQRRQPPARPIAPPAPEVAVVPDDGSAPVPVEQLQGYSPNRRGTEEFLKTLRRPTIREAGPGLFGAVQSDEPVLLYRALYEAYAATHNGEQWKVGAQGIGDCFVAGTLVTMADGRQKPIEQVQVGEHVRTHTLQWQRVNRTIAKASTARLVRLKAVGHPEIVATADHRFISDFNDTWTWRPAEQVWVGDKLLTLGDHPARGPPAARWSEVEVADIWQPAKPTTVYCLEVEKDHSFFANGYAVHNCVSWGWAHGCDVHLAVMWKLGDTSEWRAAATEAIYGGSRVEARGVNFGGWGDGSYGGSAAKWVKQWGVVFREDYPDFGHDLTRYSSQRAKQWGAYGNGGQGDGGKFDAEAKKHPVRNVALVTNFQEAAAAIKAGYPVPVCSGQGFSSRRDSQGFAAPAGSWAHCMCFTAVRFGDRPGLLCQNSWGTNWISGPKYPEDQPDGSFWVDARVCDRMLSGRDSFAVSGYEGFPFRDLQNGDWVLHQPADVSEFLVALRAQYAQPAADSAYALAP